MLRFFTPLLLFISWFVLLFVSLSVPIIHTIYLWDIKLYLSKNFLDTASADFSGDLRFGLWGYCISQLKGSVGGFSDSTHAQCTRPALGLQVDSSLARVLDIQHPQKTLNKTLTSILVLHPVTCVLAFLAFLTALHAAWRPSRAASFITLLLTGLATLTSTFVLIIDLAVVAVSLKDLKKATDYTLDVTWGNAVWMSIAATAVLWGACAGACCAICGVPFRRRRQWNTKY